MTMEKTQIAARTSAVRPPGQISRFREAEMDLAGRSPRTTPSPMLSPKSHAERSRIYARLRAASERIRVANERAVGLLVEVMDLRRSFDEMIQSLATITDSRAK